MKTYLAENNFLQSLHEIPVQNYFHYRKFMTIHGILGSDENDLHYHKFLQAAHEYLGLQDKVKIIKKNIHVLSHLIKRNENYSFYALFCLYKDQRQYDAKSLKEKIDFLLGEWEKQGLEEPKQQLTRLVSKIANYLNHQIIENGFEERSIMVNGYWRGQEEKKRFELTKRLLVGAMKKGSHKDFYNMITLTNTIEDAAQMEIDLPINFNKTLGVLRQKTPIDTAFDFYLQKKLLIEEIERKQNQQEAKKKPDQTTSLLAFKN